MSHGIAHGAGHAPATALAVGSVVSLQAGQAIAKTLFPYAGPGGVLAMRLGFAALLLCMVWRPRPP
ncbi:MAG: hypothetical protein GEV03_16025 [Streptosporangiales bacterium]|nr:hypothetical protein [Streptosporangiales bacterium]